MITRQAWKAITHGVTRFVPDKLLEVGLSVDSDTVEGLPVALDGKELHLAGFVWFQGFNDNLNDVATAQYETNFRGFISDLRSDLGRSDLPVVVAVSHAGEEDGGVRAGQRNVSDEMDFM